MRPARAPASGRAEPPRRGTLGLPLVLASLVGAAIAGYLALVRVLGEAPVCGPSRGCELVQASAYSTLFGVLPVAVLGVGFALVVLALAARWWRRGDRWALVAAYALLVLGTLFAGYLTILELVVIRAICPWCVAYALSVVTALVVAGIALLRTGRDGAGASPARA